MPQEEAVLGCLSDVPHHRDFSVWPHRAGRSLVQPPLSTGHPALSPAPLSRQPPLVSATQPGCDLVGYFSSEGQARSSNLFALPIAETKTELNLKKSFHKFS